LNSSAFAESTLLYRKVVRPSAKTLSTTPRTTCSMWYRFASTASSEPSSAPPRAADQQADPHRAGHRRGIAEAKAPNRNWPSIATFTTPERSQMMPHSAPRISGTGDDQRVLHTPGRLTPPSALVPAEAQTRNAMMNEAT